MRPWPAHVPGLIFIIVVGIATLLPVSHAFLVISTPTSATATRILLPRVHGKWSQFRRGDKGDNEDDAPHLLPSTNDSPGDDDCEPDGVGGSDGVAPPSSPSLPSPPLSVVELDGPYDAASFARSSCWGKRPCLVRDAFDVGAVREAGGWPSREDVLALAEDEDAESRLITHLPGDETSYELTIGPFENGEIEELIVAPPRLSEGDELSSTPSEEHNTTTTSSDTCWTLLVNDVDRFLPSVSDWMWGGGRYRDASNDHNNASSSAFSFVPTWRRDDGQASIACVGGGIGPHVDDYDVFLVQTCGAREWRVGTGGLVSHEMEDELLVPGIDVRILGHRRPLDEEEHPQQQSTTTLVLKAGDVLYLPPRVAHQGTALTDDCATLSVGCRAPSASELVSRIAEDVGRSNRGASVVRYADDGAEELLPPQPAMAAPPTDGRRDDSGGEASVEATHLKGKRGVGEITPRAKRKARDLVKAAMAEIIDDDDRWDAWFGSFVTEPTRIRHDYPIPLAVLQQQEGGLDGDDDDDGDSFAKEWRDSLGSVWGEPKAAVQAFVGGGGYLNQAEGVKFAYSISEHATSSSFNTSKGNTCRLFVNGHHWDAAPSLAVHIIVNERRLSHKSFAGCVICSDTRALLEDLVASGFLYGSDD